MPPCLQALVARLVEIGVCPRDVVPDSAIVNAYRAGDCIPPHGAGLPALTPLPALSVLPAWPKKCRVSGHALQT